MNLLWWLLIAPAAYLFIGILMARHELPAIWAEAQTRYTKPHWGESYTRERRREIIRTNTLLVVFFWPVGCIVFLWRMIRLQSLLTGRLDKYHREKARLNTEIQNFRDLACDERGQNSVIYMDAALAKEAELKALRMKMGIIK